MKILFLLALLSSSAFAAVDSIEVDAKMISQTGDRMVVEIGKKRIEIPANRRLYSSAKERSGKIRVKVLPEELKPKTEAKKSH